MFSVNLVMFLGDLISADGISSSLDKVEAIKNFQALTTMRQFCQFLGLVNFYYRFLPHCAQMLLPLTNITLSEHVVTAFNKVKVMLEHTVKLSHIQSNHELFLAVDVSLISIGAAL